jgi:hypothetical protein
MPDQPRPDLFYCYEQDGRVRFQVRESQDPRDTALGKEVVEGRHWIVRHEPVGTPLVGS